jgi:hypothetical protein
MNIAYLRHKRYGKMVSTSESGWEEWAARLLRTELVRRGLKAPDLAKRMSSSGPEVTSAGIRNKLSRGTFSAAFLLRALHALGSTDGQSVADLIEAVPRPDSLEG